MYKFLCLLTIVLTLTTCSTKPITTPIEPEKIQNFYSDLTINYKLYKKSIKDTFNIVISDIFKESFTVPEYDAKIYLSKTKDANVEIEGKSLLVNIPIGITVEKKTFLTNLVAKGVIEMTFITNLDVDSLWKMKTVTDLSYYKWIEKPKLSVGGLQIPIESISNVILSKTKTMISQSIDEAVNDNFDLKQKMQESLQVFNDPWQMDPPYGGWMILKPTKIQLNKVQNSKSFASGKIGFQLLSTYSTSMPKSDQLESKKLPIVNWSENIPDSSIFRLVTEIKTMDINQIVKNQFDGQTFSAEGKSITLSNIVVNCDYSHLRVVTDVKGSINGTLIISGKPFYDKVKNAFSTEDIDIKFKTKNKVHKAASWIAEGYVKRELKKMLQYSLSEQTDELQNSINEQIEELNKKYDMKLKTTLGSISVENFKLKPGIIETTLNAKLFIDLSIHNFSKF